VKFIATQLFIVTNVVNHYLTKDSQWNSAAFMVKFRRLKLDKMFEKEMVDEDSIVTWEAKAEQKLVINVPELFPSMELFLLTNYIYYYGIMGT
jgi:hypothetical protein